MKKSGSRTTRSSRKPKIQMCCDRILTGAEKIRAMELAIKEASVNRPPAPNKEAGHFLFGAATPPLRRVVVKLGKGRDFFGS